MNVEYNPALMQNATLVPAAQAREPDIQRIIGAAYEDAVASWELRTDQASRELVLVIRNGDRQAEEPVSHDELRGNGKFDSKLSRMKDSLAHNGVWRAAARALIADAQRWCEEILPGATFRKYPVTLYEERSGKYELTALEVRTSDGLLMWVEPVAGWVVNPKWVEKDPKAGTNKAIGRVDLRGPGGPVYLYCLEPDGNWVYQANLLHPDSNPHAYHRLDKTDFMKLIRDRVDA